MNKPKLFRITTIPLSLEVLLTGQLDYMKDNGFDVHAVSSSGKECKNFTSKRGIPFHTIEMTRTISPIKDLIALYKLYLLIKKERPDIVHTHTPKAGLLGMIAAYLAGTKHRIHTVAGLPLMTCTGWRKRILSWTEKITYRYSTLTLANSFSIADYLLKENFLNIDTLKVIGNGSSNGFDTKRFSIEMLDSKITNRIKNELNYSEDNFYYLFVGRLVNDKGINELFTAFQLIYKENNNTRLIILGEFEKERDAIIDQRIIEIINHPGIIYLGWRSEVEYFLEIAHVLVHPSHREGFPNILLQAAAMSTPIICSRIPGNIDIVNDDYASLFEVKNIKELALKMQDALFNYKIKLANAKKLHPLIIDKYSRENIQALILNLYKELLSNKYFSKIEFKNSPIEIKSGTYNEQLSSYNY